MQITNGTADFITPNSNGVIHAFSMICEIEKVGILPTNGELKDNEGNLLPKIDTERVVYNDENQKMVQINAAGEIDNGSGKKLSWSANGKFSFQQGDKFLQLSTNDKTIRKTASFLAYLMLTTS